MLDVSCIRDTVVAVLSADPDLIGVYTFPDGTEVPAVYVVGQRQVPEQWQVRGLEVSVRQYPEVLPSSGLGMVDVLYIWEIWLVQYHPDNKEIPDAMDRLARTFPHAKFDYFPGDDVMDEKCRIRIPEHCIRPRITGG